jgi:6-phosphogluconolactonase (cycloisomerase 2 family)
MVNNMKTFQAQFNTARAKIIGLAVVVLCAVFTLGLWMTVFAAQPSNQLTYQGRLLNSNGVPVSTSSANMQFRLYNAQSGGTCLWSNDDSGCATNADKSTPLTDGLFTVNLGNTGDGFAAIPDTVFADNTDVFLEVEVEGETLSPRKRMTAAPYAMNAQTLDGIDATGFLASDGDTATGDYDFTGANLDGTNALVFDGSTDGGDTTTFQITDPSGGSNTIIFPNDSGTVALGSDVLWQSGTNGTFEDDAGVIVGIDQAETLSNASYTLASGDLFVEDELGVEGEIYTDSGLTIDSSGETLTLDGNAIDSTNTLSINTTNNQDTSFGGDVIPATDDTYNLGSSTNRWADLYLGPASLHVGTDGNEGVLSYDTVNSNFNFDSDFVPTGDGTLDIGSDTNRANSLYVDGYTGSTPNEGIFVGPDSDNMGGILYSTDNDAFIFGSGNPLSTNGAAVNLYSTNSSINALTLQATAGGMFAQIEDDINLGSNSGDIILNAQTSRATGRFEASSHSGNQGLKLPTVSSVSGVPSGVAGQEEGDVVWNDDDNALYIYDGDTSGFVGVGGSGGGATDLDGAYDNDSDKILDIDNGALVFDPAFGETFEIADSDGLTGVEFDSGANATFNQTSNFNGKTNVNGNIDLGNEAADRVVFDGRVDSDVLPYTDDTYNLGSSSNRWQDLYLGPASLHVGTDGNEGTIGYNTTSNTLEFNDANLSSAVPLSAAGTTGLTTTANDIIGAINEAASSGGGAQNFDEVYDQSVSDANLTMEIDNASGLTYDVQTSGGFNVNNSSGDTAFSNTGGDTIVVNSGGASRRFLVQDKDALDAFVVDGDGNVDIAAAASDFITFNGTIDTNLVFEGATNDLNETSFAITDPTADRTITFPDETGEVVLDSTALWQSGTNGTFEDDAGVIVGIDQAETLSNASYTLASGDLFVEDELGVEGEIYTDSGLTIDSGTKETTFSSGTINSTGQLNINTTSNVATAFGGDVVPDTNNTHNLGSSANRWADLYLGGSTLHIGTSTTDEGTISYDTSANTFDFATDGTTQGSIAFNSDDLFIDTANSRVGIGTTSPSELLHVSGGNALVGAPAVGFDISTAELDGFLDTQDSVPNGITFNNDGTKMYEIGSGSNQIYEYDLSTAFDISTATFSQSIATQDLNAYGLTFNDDGTKMYEIGADSGLIYEYDLSTAFDISTATFSQSIATQDAGPHGITFNDDGTQMYEVGQGSDQIYQYTLSTAYDISTATFVQSIATQDTSPSDIKFNNDGTKMYETNYGFGSEVIYEYSLSTAFDISTATVNQNLTVLPNSPEGLAFNDDGTGMYVINDGGDFIYEYSLSTAFDISTATFPDSISTQDSGPEGISFSSDGTKMYEVGNSSDQIYESTLSTPFDITTATFSQSISSQDLTPTGLAFNNDGTKMYEVGYNSDLIYEYDLSTAFDISTATFGQSIAIQGANPRGLTFNNDGTKMYELDENNIYEYNLSTAFDISTATFSQSIGTDDLWAQDLKFNNDGTKMYELGRDSDLIYEWSLSTAFDISTATPNQTIQTRDSEPTGLAFNDDGTKMYEIGDDFDLIHQYTLGSPGSGGDITYTGTLTSPSYVAGSSEMILPTNAGTPSGSTTEGSIVWDTSGDVLNVFDGSSFVQLATSSGAADTLDSVYANDSDKTLTINDANGTLAFASTGTDNNLNVDLQSTGDFVIQDNGVAAFTLADDGSATFANLLSANGNVDLGDGTGDTISLAGQVDSDILPATDDTYNLGSSTNRWADLYLGPASLHVGTDGNEGTIGYNTTSNTLEFSDGNLSSAVPLSAAGTTGLTTTANDIIGAINEAASSGSGGNTLDAAYDQGGAGAGSAITADSGAVSVTTPDGSNNETLSLTQNDVTNNPDTISLTSSTGSGGFISAINTNTGFGAGADLVDLSTNIDSFSSTFNFLKFTTDADGDLGGPLDVFTVDQEGQVVINSPFDTGTMTLNNTSLETSGSTLNINGASGQDVTVGTGLFSTLGSVDLGNDNADTVTFTGQVDSNILPATNDAYDLGSPSNRWRDLYLGPETLHIGTSATDEAQFSYDTSTDILGVEAISPTNSGGIAFDTNSTSGSAIDINANNGGIDMDAAGAIDIQTTFTSGANLTATNGPITIAAQGSANDINLDTNDQVIISDPGSTADGPILSVDNNGGIDGTDDGIVISTCKSIDPTSNCDWVEFQDSGSTTIGAIEGDGGGGLNLQSPDTAGILAGTTATVSGVSSTLEATGTTTSDNVFINSLGTAADAIDVDSAGGFDLDSTGEIDLLSEDTTSFALSLRTNQPGSGIFMTTDSEGIDMNTSNGGSVDIEADPLGSGQFSVASGGPADITAGGNITLDPGAGNGIQLSLIDTTSTEAVCHSGSDTVTTGVFLEDCSGTPSADYMEMYPAAGDVATGDIVALGSTDVTTEDGDTIKQIVKSNEAYQGNVIGIASNPNDAGDFNSIGYNIADADNPYPVALSGRVPLNVNDQNGAIEPGDPITSSATTGAGMKATAPGMIVGYALDTHTSGTGQIMVFVDPGFHSGTTIANDGTMPTFDSDFAYTKTAEATSSETGKASHTLMFRGSGWDGSQAQDVAMQVNTEVADASEYRLSIKDATDSEVAYISNNGKMEIAGDMVVGGKIYPSDRGTPQTDKYIYYDGSSGGGGDMMRTNAAGWSTGSYDFAEMFPSSQELEPGDVVTFAKDEKNVRRTDKANAQTIAGVVSTQPGFLAGENIEGHHPIALAGRVPTKVSMQNGAIKVGDPLTSSDEPGVAMRAKEAGMVLGYALEPYNGSASDNKIVAFINASYYDGKGSQDALVGTQNSASQLSFTDSGSRLTSLDMAGNIYMHGNEIRSVGRLVGISDRWSVEEDGTFKTEGSYKVVVESYQGEDVEADSLLTRGQRVFLSGVTKLDNGTATVDFEQEDDKFNDITSTQAPVSVVLTPDGPAQVYITEKDNDGFTIEQMDGSDSGITVNWMVTAYRKGHEPERFLENDNDGTTDDGSQNNTQDDSNNDSQDDSGNDDTTDESDGSGSGSDDEQSGDSSSDGSNTDSSDESNDGTAEQTSGDTSDGTDGSSSTDGGTNETDSAGSPTDDGDSANQDDSGTSGASGSTEDTGGTQTDDGSSDTGTETEASDTEDSSTDETSSGDTSDSSAGETDGTGGQQTENDSTNESDGTQSEGGSTDTTGDETSPSGSTDGTSTEPESTSDSGE